MRGKIDEIFMPDGEKMAPGFTRKEEPRRYY